MAFYMGIDSGSTTAKIVVLDGEGQTLTRAVCPTGANSTKSITKAAEMALKPAGLKLEDVTYSVSTGYGRYSVNWVQRQITEISCHAKGVHYLLPEARAIIDIGGQDFKIIQLDRNGSVQQFQMNEKCAAGTGRFLEVMAKVLELELNQFGRAALAAEHPVKITSVCTVFAESEVINHVARGTPIPELVHGILDAVATRVYALAKQSVAAADLVAFTGGVAQNEGIVQILGEKLGRPLAIPPQPQYTGALGAALLAKESHEKQKTA